MVNFRILLVDDSEDDQVFFLRAIDKSEIKAQVITVFDGVSGIEALNKSEFDCIFLDYGLPGMDGLAFLKKLRLAGVDTPVIMLTGQKNEQTVVQLMKAGASDYIYKNSMTPETLRVSIESSQKLHKAQKEKILTIEALKASEARLAEAQKIAIIGNWEYDFSSKQLVLSDEAYNILGYGKKEVGLSYSKFSKQIHSEDILILKECLKNIRKTSSYDINIRYNSGKNSLKYLNAKGHLSQDKEGKFNKVVGTIQDITLLKNALNETKKAKIKSKATTMVFSLAIILFLISEALLDPFVDALTASVLISLSFKGAVALFLKPIELFLEKYMINRML
jgi:DNA-binding response OmpR family regulator